VNSATDRRLQADCIVIALCAARLTRDVPTLAKSPFRLPDRLVLCPGTAQWTWQSHWHLL